jgi:hypothetical protein
MTQSDTEAKTSQRPPAFRVHTLKQNRQVQTRNLEYFDGPVLAVLALISRIDEEPADETVEGITEDLTE